MAAFLPGILILHRMKKEEQKAKYTSWLTLSSLPFLKKNQKLLLFWEPLPVEQKHMVTIAVRQSVEGVR